LPFEGLVSDLVRHPSRNQMVQPESPRVPVTFLV